MVFNTLIKLYKEILIEGFYKPSTKINEKPRLEYIELAKGLCIFLICITHWNPKYTPDVTAYLRIPLYFFISGLFFKEYDGTLNFIEKKVNKILIPILFFHTLGFGIFKFIKISGLGRGVDGNYFDLFTINQCSFGGSWFLLCYFVINIFFYFLYKLSNKKALLLGFFCAMSGFIGYLLSHYEIRLWSYADTALSSMPFFFYGWLFGKTSVLKTKITNKYILLLSILSFACVIIYHHYDSSNKIDYHNNYFAGNLIFSYILPFIFILSSLIIIKAVKWLPFFSLIGRYSIIILCTDLFLNPIAYKLAPRQSVYSLIIKLILYIAIIPLCRYFLPFFTAQKEWFKIPRRRSLTATTN